MISEGMPGQTVPPKAVPEDQLFRNRLAEQHTTAVDRIQDLNGQMQYLDVQLREQHRIRSAAEAALGSFENDVAEDVPEQSGRYITR